ncbi:YqhA family protein [Methylocystis parvus]|uniref:YqhA family protein n=1 Tax=Methylocystis parvus TaxID=134 RepID=UPI003C753F27
MLKRLLEHYLFLSRWLLAPFFVMLTLGLFVLMVNAARHLLSILTSIGSNTEDRVILGLLGLIDSTLTGALVLLVTFSLYENFVSSVPATRRDGLPNWMGGIDFTQLKLKLLTTIVAISAIKLLEAFMDIPKIDDRDLNYYIAIHLTFVVSTVLFAFSDRVTISGQVEKRSDETPKGEAGERD